MRRLVFLAVQTGLSSWLWNNRADLSKRAKGLLKGGSDESLPDATRPIGDRFVPPIAGRGPSPFEAAKAEEAAPSNPEVAAHEQASNSHVSIAVGATVEDATDTEINQSKVEMQAQRSVPQHAV
jgi:hypothetical protein